MKKKVLLIVPSLGIGGRERIAVNTAMCMRKYFDVDIVVFQNCEGNKYSAPCRIICLNVPACNGKIKKVINQGIRTVRLLWFNMLGKYDYLISFGSAANLCNSISSLWGKGKAICSIHGYEEVKKGAILSFIIKRSSKVICIAQAMQAELLRLYPNCAKCIVIENGYVFDNHTSAQEPPPSEERGPVFISMGRLERVKGFDLLIRAFKEVSNCYNKAELWIMGEGSCRDELESEISKFDMVQKVKLLGYQKEPHKLLQEATIYVLSSRNEGFPNALIEALNARLPVIACDCKSGPREILSEKYDGGDIFGITHEKYGVLVECSEDEEKRTDLLAQAMINLVTCKSEMEYLSSCARERAHHYSLEAYSSKLMNMLDSL